jgi:hypothetical protein
MRVRGFETEHTWQYGERSHSFNAANNKSRHSTRSWPALLTPLLITYFSNNKLNTFSRGSSVSIVNSLPSGRPRLKCLQGRDSFRHRVDIGSGGLSLSYPMDTGTSPRGQSGRGLKLTIHLHLVLRLRIRRTMPPFPYTS